MTRYDFCGSLDDNGLSVVANGTKFGIYDFFDSKEIVPPTYDEIHILDKNLFAVRIGKNWGVINRDCKIVVSVRFKNVLNFYDDYLFIKEFDDTVFLMCKSTGKTSKCYSNIGGFKDGFSIVAKDLVFGVIDNNLKEVIPTKQSEIHRCKDDTFFTTNHSNICLINSSNNTVQKLPYTLVRPLACNKCPYFIVKKDNLYGLIDTSLNVVVPVKYDFITYLFDDYVSVMSVQEETSYIGVYRIGKGEIISTKYQRIKAIGLNLFSVENFDSKLALFNCEGKQITNFVYDGLGRIGLFVGVEVENPNEDYEYLVGLLDTNGKQLLEPIYDNIESKASGYVVYKDGKYGICDNQGKLVSKIVFDKVFTINMYNKSGRKFAEVVYNGEGGNFFW